MNTAEVAIEHILAGLLALCAFALPFVSRPQMSGRLSQPAVIVAVLGAAYMFGVVFDRLADTILSPLEHYTRLQLAEQQKKDNPHHSGDPFPQDILEFNLRGGNDGRLAWMDSLRSRIRTCRGLCVLGAPAVMGIAIFMRWNTHEARWHWKPHLMVMFNLILVLVLVLSLVLVRCLLAWAEGTTWEDTLKKKLTPPRTNKLNEKDKYMDPLAHALIFSFLYFLMLILSLWVTAWILPGSFLKRLAIFLGGAAIIGLSLLAWNQITKTYMSFVARQMKYQIGPPGRPIECHD